MFTLYSKYGFERIKDLIAKLPAKILAQYVKRIPESEPYLRSYDDRIKAANKTNAYGGGGSFGWAPNLNATVQKPVEEKRSALKKKQKVEK